MTERIEEEDIRNAPIKWKVPGAGFVGEGGFVALIDRDPDPFPCVVHDGPEEEREAHERTCRETWATVWGLEGDTLEEANPHPGDDAGGCNPLQALAEWPAFGEPPTT